MDLNNGLDDEVKYGTFKFTDRDRNIKDVLVHLHEWHVLLIDWINNNTKGIKKAFLPEPYTWSSYEEMNVGFVKKHLDTTYNDGSKMFEKSYKEVMALIKNFSDEEMFTKAYFDWTENAALSGFVIGTSAEHYEWAIEKIKKHIKVYKEN